MEFLERNGNVQRLAKAGTNLDDRIMKQPFGQLVQTIVEKDKKYNVSALRSRVQLQEPYTSKDTLIFRSRKKISTTYAIVLFSPDHSMKIPNFSKLTFFIAVILHPKVLLSAQWHQNCMTGI